MTKMIQLTSPVDGRVYLERPALTLEQGRAAAARRGREEILQHREVRSFSKVHEPGRLLHQPIAPRHLARRGNLPWGSCPQGRRIGQKRRTRRGRGDQAPQTRVNPVFPSPFTRGNLTRVKPT